MLKRWRWLIVFVFMLPVGVALGVSGVGSSSLGDAYFPSLGNGGYDAQHYTIDLSVNVDADSVVGTSTMDAIATQDLSRFDLDFLGLQVGDVLVNGLIRSTRPP